MFKTNNQMTMTAATEQKQEKPTCNYCGKQLYGREGKKYCNVDCKNNYNSRIRSGLRAKETAFFPKAFDQIKLNYRILVNQNIAENQRIIFLEGKTLKQLGFDPEFCTNAYVDYSNRLWRSCNNYYWLQEGDNIKVLHQTGPFNRNQ